MRRLLIPFAVGLAVGALLEIAALFSVNVLADAYEWGDFELHVGPFLLVAYEHTAHVATLSFGGGVFVLALVGGLLNAAGAAVLQRRV